MILRLATYLATSKGLGSSLISEWQERLVITMHYYIEACGCPKGLKKEMTGNLTALVELINQSSHHNAFWENDLYAKYRVYTRTQQDKLQMLLGMINFDPTPSFMDSLASYWIEDVKILKELFDAKQLSMLHLFDKREGCIDQSANLQHDLLNQYEENQRSFSSKTKTYYWRSAW